MEHITISSQVYRQQLIDLYYGDVRELAVNAGECGEMFFVTLTRADLDVHELCGLFEDIALIKNDALMTCQPNFYEFMRETVFETARSGMVQGLESYFAQHAELCVEGYMNFRFRNAQHMVDTAMYAVIKQCRQFNQYRIGETYDN